MCDPLTIGSAALSAGSMAANNSAQNRVAKARRNAMEAERARQQAYEAEAGALNEQSQGRYKGFQNKQAAKTAQLADFFTSQNQGLPAGSEANGAPAEIMPSAGTNNIVAQEVAKQKGKAKTFSDQQGRALANMRGFGDLLADNSRLQARDASQIGQIGGFMRGSSAVLPFELEHANARGAGMQTLGSILGAAGQLGMAAGLSGGSDRLFGVTNNVPAGGYGPYQATNPNNGVLQGSGSLFNIWSRQ